MNKTVIDLKGRRFSRLFVLEFAGIDRHHNSLWKCLCSCGNIKVIKGRNLIIKKNKSCGCLKKELNSGITTDGNGKKNKLYQVWSSMKCRCLNPLDKAFVNYGGRGIKVCDEWLEFKPFLDWSMISGYKKGLTIERKDNDGNYCPDNCTWISKSMQSKNRRGLIIITFNNVTMTRSDWAKSIGISKEALRLRLNNGWSIDDALTTSKLKCRRHITINI
jgi:hypothetical protein